MASTPPTLNTIAATLDDVAESIADLSTMMASEFQAVRQFTVDTVSASEERLNAKMDFRFEAVDQELKAVRHEVKDIKQDLTEVQKSQRSLLERFKLQEGVLSDIKELYDSIEQLRDDIKTLTKEERRRLADLEAFAMQVAEKTGVPFIRKPKLRS